MENKISLQEASVEQLKAAAYDEVVRLEQAQVNIRTINQELAKRSQEKKEQVEEEKISE